MGEREMTLRMKDHGEVLGTRALGERVRALIVEALRSAPGQVVLDFEGVRVMTQSFGDEVFRKLLGEVQRKEAARIVVRKISDDVRSVLRYSTSKAEPAAP